MESRRSRRWMQARIAWLVIAAIAAAAPVRSQQAATGLPQKAPSKPAQTAHVAPGVIEGWVSDTNLVPLSAAFISVPQFHLRIGTSAAGRFRIVGVPAGQVLVLVRRSGFQPTSEVVEVPAGDTLRVSYTLGRAQQSLDAVVVEAKRQSAQMREFEQRRHAGIGFFMTADQIDEHNPTMTADVLMAVPAMSVTPDQSRNQALIAMSRREGGGLTSAGEPAYCPILVMLNGVKLSQEFDLRLLPPPKDVAGIEIYSGASTVPPQYAGFDSRCGVMLIWTKDGY